MSRGEMSCFGVHVVGPRRVSAHGAYRLIARVSPKRVSAHSACRPIPRRSSLVVGAPPRMRHSGQSIGSAIALYKLPTLGVDHPWRLCVSERSGHRSLPSLGRSARSSPRRRSVSGRAPPGPLPRSVGTGGHRIGGGCEGGSSIRSGRGPGSG